MLLVFAIFITAIRVSASTGQTSTQYPYEEGSLGHTLDVGHTAAMVRRHDTQDKNLVQEKEFSDSMEIRRVAVNADSSIQPSSGQDSSARAMDADRHAAVLCRREIHGKNLAEAKGIEDLMRRVAVVGANGEISMSPGDVFSAAEETLLSASSLNARPDAPGNVSVQRTPMLFGPEATIRDSTAPSATSLPRENTPDQAPRRDQKQSSFQARQPAPLQETFPALAQAVIHSKGHLGIRDLDADPRTIKIPNALDHTSVVADAASLSQPVAATQALATVEAVSSDDTANDSAVASMVRANKAAASANLMMDADALLLTSSMSARPDATGNISVQRAMLSGPATTVHDSSRPDQNRSSFHAVQPVPLQDIFSDIAQPILHKEGHMGTRDLEANLSTTSISDTLANTSVAANPASLSQSEAATRDLVIVATLASKDTAKDSAVAPVVRVKRAAGLGPALEAALVEAPLSAVQFPSTTAVPALATTAAPVVGTTTVAVADPDPSVSTAAPPAAASAHSNVLVFTCTVALCILLAIFVRWWLSHRSQGMSQRSQPSLFSSLSSNQRSTQPATSSQPPQRPKSFGQKMAAAGNSVTDKLAAKLNKMDSSLGL